MKIKHFLSSLVLLLSYSLQAQDVHNLKHEVEKIIEFDYDLDLADGEGLWIGVIDGDSTFIFSLGNIEQDSLVEFQLGSLSKIFTYHVADQLLSVKAISQSKKITDYLELDAAYNDISFQKLLSHQSYLPKEPYFFGKRSSNPDNPYESYSDDLIISEMNKYASYYEAKEEPEFAYGHLNYALVGLAIEEMAQKDYCAIIDDLYSKKYPSIKCSDKSEDLVLGFDKTGSPILPWEFPAFAASEGISGNIIDVTNFIRDEMDSGHENSELIKISKHLYFQAPWYYLKLKRSQKTHSFSGTTSGHSVFVCYDKESESAVVMMRNSGKGILHLPLTILDMVKSSKAKSK